MQFPVLLRVLAISLFIALLWGCGKQAEKKPVSPTVKIAVCFDDVERDGNKIIKKVMTGRQQKDNVKIIWYDAGNDPQKQKQQLAKLADQKVKAAIVQFIDPVAGAEEIRGLVEKNIKVVALESLPANAPADAYVASDHSLAGQLLARFAINATRKAAGLPASSKAKLAGKFPIGAILLTGDPSDPISREIAASARTTLKGSSEVNLLSEVPVPKGDPSQASVLLQKELTRYGSSVQAVLATDSRLAVAAVQVLKNAGLNNGVITAGVGADEKAYKALESGDHDAEIDTRPDLLGQFALDAAISLANGGRWQYDGQTPSGGYAVPSRITPVRLIQSDNVFLLKQQWQGLQGSEGKKGSEDREKSGEGSGDGSGSGSDSKEGGQHKKTMLRITTQDGKTMEVEIDGEVKKIESMGGGKGGQQGEQQGQGQQ